MDLESECSALESVEDNEAIGSEKLRNAVEAKVGINGPFAADHVDDHSLPESKRKGVEPTGLASSSPPLGAANSSGGLAGSSPPTTKKGHGLRKWRRIKREVNRDGDGNLESNRVLKRGLPNLNVNAKTPMQNSAEMRKKSEGSVSSTNAIVRSPVLLADGFGAVVDPGLAVGNIYGARTDSENSEYQSSKSFTAASAPKARYDMPAMGGFAVDKNRMRGLGGKTVGPLVQHALQGKVWSETSKKPRGDWVKIEKANSHSSMESDLRSGNSLFVQGANSVTSNGGQNGRSLIYGGENSDEAHGGERHFAEEPQIGYRRKTLGEFYDVLQEDSAAELSENPASSLDQDPLIGSIKSLQYLQEELEKELQKFRELGIKDDMLFDEAAQESSLPSEFTSVDSKVGEPSSSDQLQSAESGQSSSPSLEVQVASLKSYVALLENKLEEAQAMLQMKEAKVVELEVALTSNKSPEEVTVSTRDSQLEKHTEMDTQLENLFRQKIETEVEHLAISRTIQKLRIAAVDQIALLEEQKALASDQAQMFNELDEVESEAAMLRGEVENLQTSIDTQVLNLQSRVWKFTSCFLVQLILLLVVLGLFVLQLLPHQAGVVPT